MQRYVPSFPAKRYRFTVRQLAGHLAGIRHYGNDQEFYSKQHYASVLAALSIFRNDSLGFRPGEQFGYSTFGNGIAKKQEFHADAHTASLIPAARTNVWTVEVVPNTLFVYALRREGTDRHFRIDFELTKPVQLPPPPWGARP